MPWTTLDRLFRHLSFRLVLIVTFVAAFASLVVFGFLFGSLAMSFRDQNRIELNSRLLSYWAEWQHGGHDAILERANRDMQEQGEQPFLLLLNDAYGEMIGGVIPGGWEIFSLNDTSLDWVNPGTYHTLHGEGKNFSLLLTGIYLGDGSRMVVGMSTENRVLLLRMYKNRYPIALAGIILAGIAVGIVSSRRLLKPMRRLNKEIDRIIVTGELHRRLDSSGTGDQLDELILRYNRLLDRVESLIGGMNEALDTVAHDLRTPLTSIRGCAELALSKGNKDEYEDVLGFVVEQVDQAGALLSALMDIAEAEQGMLKLNTVQCDLKTLAEEVNEVYEFVAEERGQTIALDAPQSLPMRGDPVRLRQILGNLLDNALKYGPDGGRVDLRCFAGEDEIVLEVVDDGPGVPDEEVSRVFDRLYRGECSRGSRGLGLGLSMVKALLDAYNGHILVMREKGRGALFQVKFPNVS